MAETSDVLRGFRFYVSISKGDARGPDIFKGSDTSEEMGFMRIGGLEANFDVIEWQELGDPITVPKIPDRVKFPPVVFERGVARDRNTIWEWYLRVLGAMNYGVPMSFRRMVTIRAMSKS